MRLSPRCSKKTLERPSPRVRGVHIATERILSSGVPSQVRDASGPHHANQLLDIGKDSAGLHSDAHAKSETLSCPVIFRPSH